MLFAYLTLLSLQKGPLPCDLHALAFRGESGEPRQMSSLCGCYSRQVWFGQWL